MPERLLLDEVMGEFLVTTASHGIVDAEPPATFAAAYALDFLGVHSPVLDAAFWVRGLPARLSGQAQAPVPERLSVAEGMGIPGWMVLGERSDEEVVFGAIGVFWTPTIRWKEDVDPAEFVGFDEPGWGKIACNFSVRPYGARRTLLSYECRVSTNDDAAKQRFTRYWSLVHPFVQHIMSATVSTIAQHAAS